MNRYCFLLIFFLIFDFFVVQAAEKSKKTKNEWIYPGEVWPDTEGNHIQAHGGGILKWKNTYYWYGEQRGKGVDNRYKYVGCYSSKDLMNWKFRANVLVMLPPDTLTNNWVLERPKVFCNSKTRNFVMYFHLDANNYNVAQVGIAVCKKPDGNYTYVKRFRPLGEESRDIGQFIDDNGNFYVRYLETPCTMAFMIFMDAPKNR